MLMVPQRPFPFPDRTEWWGGLTVDQQEPLADGVGLLTERGPELGRPVVDRFAGRVDPGIGAAIASIINGLDQVHDTVESYLTAVKTQGLVQPWSKYWDRCHRYGLTEVDGVSGHQPTPK